MTGTATHHHDAAVQVHGVLSEVAPGKHDSSRRHLARLLDAFRVWRAARVDRSAVHDSERHGRGGESYDTCPEACLFALFTWLVLCFVTVTRIGA